MNSLNLKHSIIFFNFCILVSPFYQQLNNVLIILCLFLILIVGISHGALDNKKGEKLFAPMENETIEVEITDPVFIDPENVRINT